MLAVALGLVVAAVLVWPSRGLPWARSGPSPAGATALGRAGTSRASGTSATSATSGASGTIATSGSGGGGAVEPTLDAAADALVLCALALQSGLGPVEALDAVADHAPGSVAHDLRVVASAHRWGQDAATAWAHVGGGWRSASLAWQAAERSGAAPSGVVLAAAQRMRREESTRVEAAVQRAGVLLVLPLGACFLPGFVGTTVVPIVIHLARTSLGPPG